jgi:hypothetical protein
MLIFTQAGNPLDFYTFFSTDIREHSEMNCQTAGSRLSFLSFSPYNGTFQGCRFSIPLYLYYYDGIFHELLSAF